MRRLPAEQAVATPPGTGSSELFHNPPDGTIDVLNLVDIAHFAKAFAHVADKTARSVRLISVVAEHFNRVGAVGLAITDQVRWAPMIFLASQDSASWPPLSPKQQR